MKWDYIIESCEHYHRCSHPLYAGECMEECIRRYEKEMGIERRNKVGEQNDSTGSY